MLEPRRPPPAAPVGRRRRALAIALAVLGVLYVGALGVVSTQGMERRLHERLHAALRARLGDVLLDEEVEVDPLFRLTFGPLELPGPRGGPPVVRIAHGTARPSLAALLRGQLEPATILLGDVRVHPGPGGRDLLALLDRARGGGRAFGAPAAGGSGERELPKLKLRGLVIVLPVLGELEVGPIDADLKLARPVDGARMWAAVSLRAGGRLSLEAERAWGTWRATIHGEELGPEALPPGLRSRAAALTAGVASVSVDLEAPADLSRAKAELRAGVEGLVLAGERIGPEPVGPLRAAASARVTWDGEARRVALQGTASVLDAASGTGSAELALGPVPTFTASLAAEGLDWGHILASLPPAVTLPPQAPRPGGTLSGRVQLSGPLLAPEDWTVAAALDLSALREAARRAGRPRLAEPFVHRPPLDAGGHGPELRVGPSSPDFVPIAELPEHVVRAVTTSEDAGFFAHAGFDFDELRNAITAGARRGRLVRGGSTISQQVAKNLFLGPERTFARKVREAAITVGLEATLPKRRILEIYLNVAEWGPGLWGIGPAARHWFGKDARALTPREAAILASVIPSPVRFHDRLLARGAVTEVWEERVRDLLFTMNQQGALSDAQLAAALDEPVTFGAAVTAGGETAEPVPAAAGAPQPGPAPARAAE